MSHSSHFIHIPGKSSDVQTSSVNQNVVLMMLCCLEENNLLPHLRCRQKLLSAVPSPYHAPSSGSEKIRGGSLLASAHVHFLQGLVLHSEHPNLCGKNTCWYWLPWGKRAPWRAIKTDWGAIMVRSPRQSQVWINLNPNCFVGMVSLWSRAWQ